MGIAKWLLGSSLILVAAAVLLHQSRWHHRFVDLTARRPAGRLGRLLYRDAKQHHESFRYLLDKLALTPDDVLLDVCCGGGTLLQMALQTVNRAAGLDYSPDMVALTKENNQQAVAAGRLDVRQGDAVSLPWPDATFDAVANANAFVFIEEPLRCLRETHRVLTPGGRFVMVTTAPRRFARLVYGPWHFALRLYTCDGLADMLREAGFTAVEAYLLDAENQIGCGMKDSAVQQESIA
jgi:ubiquinone/menaquinone biosynthesis C-methylase UbiE